MSNTKICSDCHYELPLSSFNDNIDRPDGKQTACIGCRAKYNKQHYLNNKDAYKARAMARRLAAVTWLQEYKKDKRCARCPENFVACLQFHHVNPNDKDMDISSAAANGWSIERIKKEIDKCIILCANCHTKEHHQNC